jgi:ribosome-associated protein
VELSVDLRAASGIPEPLRARALARLAGRFPDGVVVVVASEHRSQWRNREAARGRLAALLASAMAPPPRSRRATRPSRSSVERRLSAKRRRGEVKRLRRGSDDG